MTKAQNAAWEIYIARIQGIVDEQRQLFEAGHPSGGITVAPPTVKHVAIIQAVIDEAAHEARQAILHAALSPLVDACDAIDSLHSKSEAVKACRERLDAAYHTLHALKDSAPPQKGADERP